MFISEFGNEGLFEGGGVLSRVLGLESSFRTTWTFYFRCFVRIFFLSWRYLSVEFWRESSRVGAGFLGLWFSICFVIDGGFRLLKVLFVIVFCRFRCFWNVFRFRAFFVSGFVCW